MLQRELRHLHAARRIVPARALRRRAEQRLLRPQYLQRGRGVLQRELRHLHAAGRCLFATALRRNAGSVQRSLRPPHLQRRSDLLQSELRDLHESRRVVQPRALLTRPDPSSVRTKDPTTKDRRNRRAPIAILLMHGGVLAASSSSEQQMDIDLSKDELGLVMKKRRGTTRSCASSSAPRSRSCASCRQSRPVSLLRQILTRLIGVAIDPRKY